MEPLAALGIAAAAVQFFEFSRGLIKDVKAIKDAQEYRPIQHVFEKAASYLNDLSNTFQSQPNISAGANERVARQQQALNKLLLDCARVANELIDFLEELKPQINAPRWAELRRLMKSRRTVEKIERFEEQITAYQSQLTVRFLAYLDAKLDASSSHHDSQFAKLQDKQAKVMEVIALSREKLISTSTNNSNRILSAIFKLADGGTMTMTAKETESDHLGSLGLEKLQMLTLQSNPTIEEPVASLSDSREIQWFVLGCLKFRHIRDRYDTVKQKHIKTFEWLFRLADVDLPWSSFPSWFDSNSPCYWINGKPGAGKTTLMKFIVQDTHTKLCMQCWAHSEQRGAISSSNKVLSASFFFWNLGPFELQKSQSGLLRSLLHDILEQAPALIPKVVPELCSDIMKSNSLRTIHEPTLPELKRWFGRLLETASPALRFCFIIDGFDEYVGDFDELTRVLLGEPRRFVKFIVSSRPTIPCIDAFSRYPSLRLQDLTREDIRNYTEDTLTRTIEGFGLPMNNYDLSPVVEEICRRSSGVFLWVILVVKSLLQGIKNGDSIHELPTRLQEIPSDLAELYQRILDRIPRGYRQQAANLFRVMIQSVEYGAYGARQYPVTAIQMSFAESTYDDVIKAPMQMIKAEEFSQRCASVDRRIRSRCGGLLEINTRVVADTTWLDGKTTSKLDIGWLYDEKTPCVEFIHLSVVEFFKDTDALTQLSQGYDDVMDDPCVRLFSSRVGVFKSSIHPRVLFDRNVEGTYLITTLTMALLDAQDAEDLGHPLPPMLLKAFDETMSHHWNTAYGFRCGESVHAIPEEEHWVRAVLCASFQSRFAVDMFREFNGLGFRGLAILLSLPSYIEYWLANSYLDSQAVADVCTELLYKWSQAKLLLWVMESRVSWDKSAERSRFEDVTGGRVRGPTTIGDSPWGSLKYRLLLPPWTSSNTRLVRLLLEAGADPNQCMGMGASAFRNFLILILMYLVHDRLAAKHVLTLLELFLSYGADSDRYRRPQTSSLQSRRSTGSQ
ncbi:hypothetical protein F5Y04DRAFT_121247 [Hypomontagnella monticulosa]|nr:hypothetical protein F5Y04DRAFT_121247 [Hypomontagnella monticulosa]